MGVYNLWTGHSFNSRGHYPKKRLETVWATHSYVCSKGWNLNNLKQLIARFALHSVREWGEGVSMRKKEWIWFGHVTQLVHIGSGFVRFKCVLFCLCQNHFWKSTETFCVETKRRNFDSSLLQYRTEYCIYVYVPVLFPFIYPNCIFCMKLLLTVWLLRR